MITPAAKRLKIYAFTEESLFNKASTGAIFSLINNYGWKDKKEVETKASVTISNYKELTTEELKKLAGE
jgi:hypothetical protein